MCSSDLRAARLLDKLVVGVAINTGKGPLFGIDGNPAAWPSERGPRVGCQRLDSRFLACRQAPGLDDGLDFHSIRRFLSA